MLKATVGRATVAHPIINTGRNQRAVGLAGEIVIASTKCLRTAHATGPKQLPPGKPRWLWVHIDVRKSQDR